MQAKFSKLHRAASIAGLSGLIWIFALRPVAVESMDYATRDYSATAVELNQFEQRTHGQIEKARKVGKLHDFTGDIEALLEGKGL